MNEPINLFNIKEMLTEITDGINITCDELRETGKKNFVSIILLRNVRMQVQNVKDYINSEESFKKLQQDKDEFVKENVRLQDELSGLKRELTCYKSRINHENGVKVYEFSKITNKILLELRYGKKINAIKFTREEFGCGLLEAKNFIEAFIGQFPTLYDCANCMDSSDNSYLNRATGLIKDHTGSTPSPEIPF